jgi:hypothetical protein
MRSRMSPGRQRGKLHLELFDPALLLRDERRLGLELAAQLPQVVRFGRRSRARAGASGEQRGEGDRAEAQADSPSGGRRAAPAR